MYETPLACSKSFLTVLLSQMVIDNQCHQIWQHVLYSFTVMALVRRERSGQTGSPLKQVKKCLLSAP